MKIRNITVKNFRSIVECSFTINGLLALVGRNNCGKSNLVAVLEMFLAHNKAGDIYDFNDADKPIEIEVIFNELTDFEKNKAVAFLHDDILTLRKRFSVQLKDNGDFDSKSELFYVKNNAEQKAPAKNPFTGELLPEFYLVPAVKELKDETKTTGTTYFGKFLDLVFGSDNYDFSNLDSLLSQLKDELSRSDENAPLVKSAKEIEQIMSEQFKDSDLTFKIEIPKRKSLISQLDIFSNDGKETPLSTKGHGTQRAFIFSILLLYAQKLNNKLQSTDGKDKKDLIIAIEEPEIYLHPQQQKIIYRLFKRLVANENEQIQIIYTTHSSFMINIEDYKHLGFVSKKNTISGTKICQCVEDIFEEDEKQEFKTMCQFDPERNEMFFADKILLCEGDTEKHAIPVILDKLSLNPIEKRTSIVECGSKSGIPLFQKVMNKFNVNEIVFDYYVVHDLDLPPKDFKDEQQKINLENNTKELNKKILDSLDKEKIFIFNQDFEQHLSLNIGNRDKPYKARKALLTKTLEEIPQDIKTFLLNSFSENV